MVESNLHLELKKAATTLTKAGQCSYEYDCLWGDLRVDVRFMHCHREYLVECETRPNIRRLQDKGRRRNRIKTRNVYILVSPTKTLERLSINELWGYFDKIYGYDAETCSLSLHKDLRVLGGLRDKIHDTVYPGYVDYIAPVLTNTYRLFLRTINTARGHWKCFCCHHSIPHKKGFCPRWDCPKSHHPYLDNLVYIDDETLPF